MARTGKPTSAAPAGATGFKGNKLSLPHKPCMACGRAMSWRRAWARNWAEVKYCSDACRGTRGQPVSRGPRD